MSGQNLMEIDQIVFESGLENQYAILFAGTVWLQAQCFHHCGISLSLLLL